jgi:phosphoglycolate phosphatase
MSPTEHEAALIESLDEKADPAFLASLPSRQYVFIDFDGTIGDTAKVTTDAPIQAMHEIGMTDEEIGDASRLIGPTWPFAFMDVYGMDEELAQALTDRSHEIRLDSDQSAFDLFDGAVDFLAALREAGRTCVVVSARESDYLERTVAAKGIAGYFDFAVGQDDFSESGKTSLAGKAMEHFGAKPDECVVIGDRCQDVEMGHHWGIPTIGCAWGIGGTEELVEAGADYIVSDYDELTSLLLP